jgi:hypothetical protein
MVLLASCTSDAGDQDAAAADADSSHRSIDEGDWFVCANEACTDLQTTGLRMADHQVFHLIAAEQADGHFTEGDPYCLGERFGTYELGGTVLTLMFHDGGLTAQSEFVIDDGGFTAQGGEMHKVEDNATGRWVDKTCVSDD